MKNFWIIAGEASGDMYGAQLAGELRKLGKARNRWHGKARIPLKAVPPAGA